MLWLIPLLAFAAAPLLFIAGRRWERRTWRWLNLLLGVSIAALLLIALGQEWQGDYAWSSSWVLQLGLGTKAALFAFTLILVATPILLFAGMHEPQPGLPRLMALLWLFIGAMLLLLLAEDLLTLLIGWELVGACSWALINQQWRTAAHTVSANHAFLVTRAGDLGLFIAVFSVAAGSGSLAYSALDQLHGPALQLFTAGILIAAAAKSALLPFSPWLFAAMAGPVSVSALLHAATMVAAGVFLLVRLHDTLSGVDWFAPVTLAIGLATAILAGLVASTQLHAKKLLAASTSAHFGLMWVAVGAGFPLVATMHFISHAVMKAGLFMVTGVAGTARPESDGYDLNTLSLGRQHRLLALAGLILSLALGGLFPLGAAWSKEKIVTAAGHIAPWLGMVAILAAVLCAVYAARWQGHLFGQPARRSLDDRPRWELGPIFALALITLLFALVWLPGVAAFINDRLPGRIPDFKAWELALSMALVVGGGFIGWQLSRHPERVMTPAGEMAAGWFGLPWLAQRGIESPLNHGSQALARFDDRWDALLVSSAQGIKANGARVLARFDDRWDARLVSTARNIRQGARGLAYADDHVVNRGLLYSARLGETFSRLSDRVLESRMDRLVEGLARLAGRGGAATRQLQTGLTHHYYSLTWVGVAVLIILLIAGELS